MPSSTNINGEGISNKRERKACDLCYRRRMKCDAQHPRCSHCVIYDSECTRKLAARKAASRKPVAPPVEQTLESRVKTLEAQLSAVLEKVDRLGDHLQAETTQQKNAKFGVAQPSPRETPQPSNIEPSTER